MVISRLKKGKQMPRFPRQEAEIQPLAASMAFGLWDNSSVFPQPPVSVFALSGKINLYIYSSRLNFPVCVLCIYLSEKQLHRALPGIFIPDGYKRQKQHYRSLGRGRAGHRHPHRNHHRRAAAGDRTGISGNRHQQIRLRNAE